VDECKPLGAGSAHGGHEVVRVLSQRPAGRSPPTVLALRAQVHAARGAGAYIRPLFSSTEALLCDRGCFKGCSWGGLWGARVCNEVLGGAQGVFLCQKRLRLCKKVDECKPLARGIAWRASPTSSWGTDQALPIGGCLPGQ